MIRCGPSGGRAGLPRMLPVSRAAAGYYLAVGQGAAGAALHRPARIQQDARPATDAAACIRAALGYEPEIRETAGTEVAINSSSGLPSDRRLGCPLRSVPDPLFTSTYARGRLLGAAFRGRKDSEPRTEHQRKTASGAVQRLVWLAEGFHVQMSYLEREEIIGRPKTYICRITDQAIERFYAETGCY